MIPLRHVVSFVRETWLVTNITFSYKHTSNKTIHNKRCMLIHFLSKLSDSRYVVSAQSLPMLANSQFHTRVRTNGDIDLLGVTFSRWKMQNIKYNCLLTMKSYILKCKQPKKKQPRPASIQAL